MLRLSTDHVLQQCVQHMYVCDSRTEFCQRVTSLLQVVLCSRLHNSKNNEYLALKRVEYCAYRLDKDTYLGMVFEKVTPVYKKSPRDSPYARVSPPGQPRNFHDL